MLDKGGRLKIGYQIYTPEERVRRDGTLWTVVQGVLAPVQFVVFIISLILVVRYFVTGAGYEVATLSIVAKTFVLYLIMITGAIWEKVVFGQYLLAPSFFWEDTVSFFVIAMHSAYLLLLLTDLVSDETKLFVALFAYFLYFLNALQFLIKFRNAKMSVDSPVSSQSGIAV